MQSRMIVAAAVAARPPLLELDREVLLHIVSVGGFGSRTLSSLACTCTRLRDQAEMMSMKLVGQRPDQGRAPRRDGQRWLAALRALEEVECELGAYVSPHHEAFVVAVSKGGGKAGRRRFRLWREMRRLFPTRGDCVRKDGWPKATLRLRCCSCASAMPDFMAAAVCP